MRVEVLVWLILLPKEAIFELLHFGQHYNFFLQLAEGRILVLCAQWFSKQVSMQGFQ